jgi:DNA polymerase III subunit epsilon
MPSLSFAAIDFETANHRPDSPCQVAVVISEEGKLSSEKSWMIKPKDLYFSERCIAVHGILPSDVKHAPEFDQVWTELWSWIEGRVLLAHNATFDIGVLSATLAAYEIACPNIEFQCTRLIARRAWPGRHGYGLKPTAEMLGIAFDHHVAVEDARTCAKVALAAAETARAGTLDQLEKSLAIVRGRVTGTKRENPKTLRRPKSAKQALEAPAQLILQQCQELQPLKGKRFFVSGELLGMNASDAKQFLESLGAGVDSQLAASTDYWLVGPGGNQSIRVDQSPTQDESQSSSDQQKPKVSRSSKDSDTASSSADSSKRPTKILSQRQFLAMIPNGLQTVRTLVDR